MMINWLNNGGVNQRRLSLQLFCACYLCNEDSSYPLGDDRANICLCKCKTKKLIKACWNLRKCSECKQNDDLIEQGERRRAQPDFDLGCDTSESMNSDDSLYDDEVDGDLVYDDEGNEILPIFIFLFLIYK